MKIAPALMIVAALTAAACSNAASEDKAETKAEAPASAPAEATPAPAATPTPAPAPVVQAATPAPAPAVLPVPFGKYAVNATCAEAAQYDEYLGLSAGNWSEIDGDTEIGPFEDKGGGRWAMGHGSGLTITVTGPKSFTENGRRMTWCKA